MIEFDEIDKLVRLSINEDIPWNVKWLDSLYMAVEKHVHPRLNYYRFLYYLVQRFQPAVSIEIGVEFGIGSACMCLAAESYGGKVIGIDVKTHEIPRFKLPRKVNNYTYIVNDSIEIFTVVKHIAESFNGVRNPVGLVFQDSSHHYDSSVMEWDLYTNLMSDNGIWVCDDVAEKFIEEGEEKGMLEYFQERPGRRKLYPELYKSDHVSDNAVGVILI